MHGTEDIDEAVLEPEQAAPMPVPIHGEVRLLGRVHTSEEAADFGTYRGIVLVGTEDKQMILPQDNKRVVAWITCTGTGPVYLGSEAQCAAVKAYGAAGSSAYPLATGMTLRVQNKEVLWMIPDGTHSATVGIAQEKMR